MSEESIKDNSQPVRGITQDGRTPPRITPLNEGRDPVSITPASDDVFQRGRNPVGMTPLQKPAQSHSAPAQTPTNSEKK